jgi:hypothetical protein|tara:strand:- start:1218 stop:1325 length:108 start_codon:yes stop_codon:yes gene_type:complete
LAVITILRQGAVLTAPGGEKRRAGHHLLTLAAIAL